MMQRRFELGQPCQNKSGGCEELEGVAGVK